MSEKSNLPGEHRNPTPQTPPQIHCKSMQERSSHVTGDKDLQTIGLLLNTVCSTTDASQTPAEA